MDRLLASLAFVGSFALAEGSLFAQEEVINEQPTTAGPLDSWLGGDHALGGVGTMRSTLEEKGVEFFGGYAAEMWGNTSGGLERGSVYTGLLDFGVNLDFEKMVGWRGASFNTTWLWLSGRDISEDKVGNFLTVSNIAGFNTLRSFEMWFQQEFFTRGGDNALPGLSVRIGQLSADTEFIISDYGATFLNGTFGWPAFTYTNIPDGGPGYPMGAPGVRIAITPVEGFTFQTAVYQGDVFPQDVNRSGFRWRLNRTLGYFWINEAQIRWNHSDRASGLPGQLKLGAWFDSADFAAARGNDVSWGNSGYYAVLDQQLYREPHRAESTAAADGKSTKSFQEPVPLEPSNQGLGGFTRISFAPQDRNFVGFYFEAGLVYTGLIPGRDNDVTGLALACADLTNGAAQTIFDEGARKVGYEMVIEGTYDAEITPWLHVQPDLQYIVRPGGSGVLGNALVLGGRVSVIF